MIEAPSLRSPTRPDPAQPTFAVLEVDVDATAASTNAVSGWVTFEPLMIDQMTERAFDVTERGQLFATSRSVVESLQPQIT
jgi:hypothetical protein